MEGSLGFMTKVTFELTLEYMSQAFKLYKMRWVVVSGTDMPRFQVFMEY
jgi:hypothetical protein